MTPVSGHGNRSTRCATGRKRAGFGSRADPTPASWLIERVRRPPFFACKMRANDEPGRGVWGSYGSYYYSFALEVKKYPKLLDELPSESVNVSSRKEIIFFVTVSQRSCLGLDICHRISPFYCATFIRGWSTKHQQSLQTWYDSSLSALHTSSNKLKSYSVWTGATSRRNNIFSGYLTHRQA